MKAILRTSNNIITISVTNVSIDIATKTIQIEVNNPRAVYTCLYNAGFDVDFQGRILVVHADNITCIE